MPRFPVHYVPRPYQAELHKMWRDNRIGVAVLPRQSGKDVAMSMEMVERRLRTPKTTGVYISLDNPMIRDILWDKTYNDPVSGEFIQMLQDNVPSNLVDWKATNMVGVFKNKSRLKLQGYFQSGKGKNGVGTSFQDYAFTELALFFSEDPMPRLQPILRNRYEEKKLLVASTPRGKYNNPLWKLMEEHEGEPGFKVIKRDIAQLNEMMVRAGLEPILLQHELDQIRETYLRRFGNDRMFLQEYYVSFDDIDAAAVYGEAYMRLIHDKRNVTFNLDPGHPVFVAFDIGSAGKHSDATTWIAFQWYNGRLFLFDCGEGHGKPLPEYVDELRLKPWFPMLQTIVLPWDAEHHSAAVSTTAADLVRQRFPSVAVLAKSNKAYKVAGSANADVITDIQMTRMALYNTIIHPVQCMRVLECMQNYKFEFNNKLQQFSETPLHDKYSHMMDALRYTVQATKDLDFFKGRFFNQGGSRASIDYAQDWKGKWANAARHH